MEEELSWLYPSIEKTHANHNSLRRQPRTDFRIGRRITDFITPPTDIKKKQL